MIGVFDTNDVDEFMRIFNDPATAEAMTNDKITGGVEFFVLKLLQRAFFDAPL